MGGLVFLYWVPVVERSFRGCWVLYLQLYNKIVSLRKFGDVIVIYMPILLLCSLSAEAVGFFGEKNPQHAFLRKGSKVVCLMSQICGM
jgi:hypothetical protein